MCHDGQFYYLVNARELGMDRKDSQLKTASLYALLSEHITPPVIWKLHFKNTKCILKTGFIISTRINRRACCFCTVMRLSDCVVNILCCCLCCCLFSLPKIALLIIVSASGKSLYISHQRLKNVNGHCRE